MATIKDTPSSHEIRAKFASALSQMYRSEVPRYGTLLGVVSTINRHHGDGLSHSSQHRVEVESHGAIRLSAAAELQTMRLFAIMDRHPVDYYDLTVAGLRVHAPCFRPLASEALGRNPFRVFTSLLRLDLIHDAELRSRAEELLSRWQTFTPGSIAPLEKLECSSTVHKYVADNFLREADETFRWHKTTMVDMKTYKSLQKIHPLVTDVVCFKRPHINHLTPRVLDIDAAQMDMKRQGLRAKEEVEGPLPRQCKFPILLRQTSLLALKEEIAFSGGHEECGKHRARFGEIEQRGMALIPKGRHGFSTISLLPSRSNIVTLAEVFRNFPDHLETLRSGKLAYLSRPA